MGIYLHLCCLCQWFGQAHMFYQCQRVFTFKSRFNPSLPWCYATDRSKVVKTSFMYFGFVSLCLYVFPCEGLSFVGFVFSSLEMRKFLFSVNTFIQLSFCYSQQVCLHFGIVSLVYIYITFAKFVLSCGHKFKLNIVSKRYIVFITKLLCFIVY